MPPAKRPTFGADLRARGVKTHNNARGKAAKVALRERLLDAIGPDRARVFDAFAGKGEMHRAVWSRAAGYVGCDLEWHRDARRVFVADNRTVMRAVDLAPHNVFDLDAFGSPWEQMLILGDRRPWREGEPVAIALTEGEGLKLNMGGVPRALAQLAGVPTRLPHANRMADELADAALRAWLARTGTRLVRHWRTAERTGGSQMRYSALLVTR